MSTPAVVVVTHFPSPYQVELFDAVNRRLAGGLAAHYMHRQDRARYWAESARGHAARFLDDRREMPAALDDMRQARLVVFNYYQDTRALALLRARVRSALPWCFWGERPGYRHALLGRWLRRWTLDALHRSRRPIWGIGQWAVDAYGREFGPRRPYANIPYFSDLTAFLGGAAPALAGAPTLLYSGTLSRRKGVDLLARAFVEVAASHPGVRLKLMGRGALEPEVRRILAPAASRVEWVGFKPWAELAGVYASAHILCVPSRHDGWGLVVAEGLAAGLPVIGTDRTGATIDLVRPGENGWICRAGSAGALADAMRAATSLDAAAWGAMSRAARAGMHAHTLERGVGRFLRAVNWAMDDGQCAQSRES